MKNNILTRLFAITTTIILCISCSKDGTLQPNKEGITPTGKMAPAANGATVIGLLNPAPATSDITVIQGQWLLVGQTSADKGSFMIGNIPAGTYDLRIQYTTTNNPTDRVIFVRGIIIREEQTTDVGTINLE